MHERLYRNTHRVDGGGSVYRNGKGGIGLWEMRGRAHHDTQARIFISYSASSICEDDVACVDDARDVSEDGEENVDGQMIGASLLKEYSHGLEEEGAEELGDISARERHRRSAR
ncbi:hypothetical protein PMAYCL1PPCAC_02568, partial [Pristionchus mayeri]